MSGSTWTFGVAAAALLLLPAALAHAGDVSVRVRVGDLRINARGNDAAQIEVEPLGGGEFRVTGLAGTTINGLAEVIFDDIRGDVTIYTGGNGDLVRVVNFGGAGRSLSGELTIDTSSGNDTVELIDVFVNADLRISTGGGDDMLTIDGGSSGDDVDIQTGRGFDTVTVRDATLDDELRVGTSSGDDTVTIDSCNVADDVTILTGPGDDAVALVSLTIDDSLRISTREGNDQVTLNSLAVGDDVELTTSGGDDVIGVFDTSINDDLVISSGGGRDVVTGDVVSDVDDLRVALGSGPDDLFLQTADVNLLKVRGGRGNDEVVLRDVVGDDLRVAMDADDDTLRLLDDTEFTDAELDGGRGRRDALRDDGTTVLDAFRIRRFEDRDI